MWQQRAVMYQRGVVGCDLSARALTRVREWPKRRSRVPGLFFEQHRNQVLHQATKHVPQGHGAGRLE